MACLWQRFIIRWRGRQGRVQGSGDRVAMRTQFHSKGDNATAHPLCVSPFARGRVGLEGEDGDEFWAD